MGSGKRAVVADAGVESIRPGHNSRIGQVRKFLRTTFTLRPRIENGRVLSACA